MFGAPVHIIEDVEGDLVVVIIFNFRLLLVIQYFGHILHCLSTHHKFETENPPTGLYFISKSASMGFKCMCWFFV